MTNFWRKFFMEVFAEGFPKGQPRPRAFSRGGKASVYDPATAEGWKSAIAIACRPWAGRRVSEPVFLRLVFYMPRPKSHYKKDGSLTLSGSDAMYVKTPDVDNLAKAVMDCMTSLQIWVDDAQVVELSVFKRYTNGATGCQIEVATINGHKP